MTLLALSTAWTTGTVHVPRAWVRRVLLPGDDGAALVGLALPALVHAEAVVAGGGDDAVQLEPGECLVSINALARIVGRGYYPTATYRALHALEKADIVRVRECGGPPVGAAPGAGRHDACDPTVAEHFARPLVVGIKGWGGPGGPSA